MHGLPRFEFVKVVLKFLPSRELVYHCQMASLKVHTGDELVSVPNWAKELIMKCMAIRPLFSIHDEFQFVSGVDTPSQDRCWGMGCSSWPEIAGAPWGVSPLPEMVHPHHSHSNSTFAPVRVSSIDLDETPLPLPCHASDNIAPAF